MRQSPRIWIFVVTLLVLGSVACFAQNSLTENPNYRKAIEMQRLAQQYFDSGDYQKSMDYSAQAKELSKVALVEAENQRMKWMANSYMNRAADRIGFGEKNHAAARYPDIWTQATASFAVARQTFDTGAYQNSIDASTKVIDLMASVEPEKKTPVAIPTKPASTSTLPASYTVRLIDSQRDCLWRIAEYPFVYGDPWKWRLLYEANKEQLPDPNNPDLILPGMVLTIPSASGEVREGTWVPTP